MAQFNPFGLPGNSTVPGTQSISWSNTLFENLRWYLVSNFRQMLSEAYVELGLVQTIVDVPIDDALRGGIDIKSKQLSEEQIAELQTTLDRDDDLNIAGQAGKWDRLFGGAGVLILTDQDPETPLDIASIGKDTDVEFRAVDLWELFWDKQNSEGYDPSTQTEEFDHYTYYGQKVHKSRVMRLKGITAPSFIRPRLRGWGISVVEILVRSINQYLKATDLAFQVLDQFKIDYYKLKGLINTLELPDGGAAVHQRISIANQQKNYQHAVVLDSEDEFEQKTLAFAGVADMMKEIRMQVASDLRMPLTKLFGISAAGFNSGEDDIEVYNGMVESQVRNKLKYIVMRMVEIKCQKLFGMIPDDMEILFQPLRMLSAVDEETVKKSQFDRLLQAFQAGLITQEQAIDGCNSEGLFPVEMEAQEIELGNPSDGEEDVVKEEGQEAKDDIDNPGVGRKSTQSPEAKDVGGIPKGKVKAPPKETAKEPPDEKQNVLLNFLKGLVNKMEKGKEVTGEEHFINEPISHEEFWSAQLQNGPLWEKAKKRCQEEYGEIKWPVVMTIYKKEGGKT